MKKINKERIMNNKNNDKNNNQFADLKRVATQDILELDAKYLDWIGGGTGSVIDGPVTPR